MKDIRCIFGIHDDTIMYWYIAYPNQGWRKVICRRCGRIARKQFLGTVIKNPFAPFGINNFIGTPNDKKELEKEYGKLLITHIASARTLDEEDRMINQYKDNDFVRHRYGLDKL